MKKYQPIADLIKDIAIRLKLNTVEKMREVFPDKIIASTHGRAKVIYHDKPSQTDEYVNSAIVIEVGQNKYRVIATAGCWDDHLPDLIKHMEDHRDLFTEEEITRAKGIQL